MQNKNTGLKVFQIILAAIGAVLMVIFLVTFISTLEGITSADAGQAVATVLILLPFQFVATGFCAFFGIGGIIPAAIQYSKKEKRTPFELTMLIYSIALAVLPIILDVLTLVIANSING